MKYLLTISFIVISLLSCNKTERKENQEITNITSTKMKPTSAIYDIKINSLTGKPINLNDFKGKKLLFVNVASECGYTPQYKDLQQLHETYKDKLVIIGVPCNQFGEQEPGNAQEIQQFCSKNYGVDFLITEKVDVKGENQHPLYHWLTSKEINGRIESTVKWNFQKYLIDENGEIINFFNSEIKPLSTDIIDKL